MNFAPVQKRSIRAPKGPWILDSISQSQGSLGYGCKKVEEKKLWRELFSGPAQWRDHSRDKSNPIFSRPQTQEACTRQMSKWIRHMGRNKAGYGSPWAVESKFSSGGVLGGYGRKKAQVAKLWLELFSDPAKWRDHRWDTPNPSFSVFKHKQHKQKALWLNSKWTPPWVEEKLAALQPDSIQLSTYSKNQQLSRFVQAGQYDKVIELFQQMQCDGNLNRFSFFPVMKACTKACDRAAALELGRRAHEEIIRRGCESDAVVGTCLIDMYAKWGNIEEAERVFNQMPTRDVVTLTTMIGGYVKCGKGQKALELFEQMHGQGVDPNPVTFVGVLKACASVEALEVGRHTHEEIIRRGYETNVVVGTCLVDMYAKCGSIVEAQRVFMQMPTRDVVTWTAMIGAYVKCREGHKALELFEQMQVQGVDPNRVTFVEVLNACASVAALEVGRRSHEEIIRRGYESDIIVGTSLVDMYAKCGRIEEAERVFKHMPKRSVITFNAMIGGYVKCGEEKKALELFDQMQRQGVDPSRVSFVGVLSACASVAALEVGRRGHEAIIGRGYESDPVVGTCLIDMYAKCGSIEEAERVFKQLPTRSVITWTALLAGYGIHGHSRRALETFKEMCKVVEVNSVTFLSLLSACTHGGLVVEGLEYFKSMSSVYNITPTVEHFACVVDLLGRAGHLDEAENLIMSMPLEPDIAVWMALLAACRAHVNVEVGERCVKRVLDLEPDNAAALILLSNIYVAAGKFNNIQRLHGDRLSRGVKKLTGCTWIEVDTQVHSFVVDDIAHPQIVKIHAELQRLSCKMKDSVCPR